MSGQKVDYSKLELGYEFPPASYQLDSSKVAAYLRAVSETSDLYQDLKIVPPTAVATLAMAALLEHMTLPSGAIHVSQELEFIRLVNTEDTITSYAKVTKKQKRGRFHLSTIGLNAFNNKQEAVLAGEINFILPEQD